MPDFVAVDFKSSSINEGVPITMVDQPLRVGVIGLGVGRAHADGYVLLPGASLVTLCDADETRLTKYAQKYNIPEQSLITDYRQMLAKAKLDLVSVCLPNFLHAEVTVAALNAGVHVLCEKPMAPSVVQADQMLEAARRNNRKLMIAYNYRYRPDVQWIRRVVQSGQLGSVYHVY